MDGSGASFVEVVVGLREGLLVEAFVAKDIFFDLEGLALALLFEAEALVVVSHDRSKVLSGGGGQRQIRLVLIHMLKPNPKLTL